MKDNYGIRQVRLAAILFLMGCVAPALAAASPAGCGWINQAIAKQGLANKVAAANINKAVNLPPQNGPIARCLAEIQNLGAAFNFEIPTNLFGSLVSQACSMSTSYINQNENQYLNNYTQYPGVQVQTGAGQSGLNYNVNNDSAGAANQIWNAATGSNSGY